jgi:MFS family permease
MSTNSPINASVKEHSHKEIMVILGGLMTGMLLAALDQTIVSTALKSIVEEFDGLNHYTWVVTAYLLTSTASTPLYGKISDIYGRRVVFQFAIVTFLLGSILAGASQNMEQLIATRALQGLGAGGLMALTFVIIGDIVPPRERGRYQGYFGDFHLSQAHYLVATFPIMNRFLVSPAGAGFSTSTFHLQSLHCL